MAISSLANSVVVVGNNNHIRSYYGIDHHHHSKNSGSSSSMSYKNHEELSINIIIPPKPDGMNASEYNASHDEDDRPKVDGAYSSTSLLSFSSTATRGIELKTIMSHEEDLAASKLPFVWKLYEMLEDVEANGQEDIVSWIDDGRAFRVHSMERFVNDIVPKYFRQSKYKSFQRQLYFYDFQRITSGPDAGAYSHPKFVKGVKTMCLSMMPKKNSRRRSSATSSPPAKSILKKKENAEAAVPQEASIKEDTSTDKIQKGGDPSEWMTQIQSIVTYPNQQQQEVHDHYHHPERRQRSSPSIAAEQKANDSSTYSRTIDRAAPNDGDTVFLFGGKPFHFVDVDFDDMYPSR